MKRLLSLLLALGLLGSIGPVMAAEPEQAASIPQWAAGMVADGYALGLFGDEIYTDYSQGIPEPTELPLDFAIVGDGFFAVQDPEGNVGYTRMGNFSLDDEGYLCLPGFGQVLDPQGQPIYLGTDKIRGDSQGVIYFDQPPEQGGGAAIGQLGVYSFEDNQALERNDRGLFTGEGAQQSTNFQIWNKYLERSNSDMVKQMTEMITYQRALQSAAQVTKMYDQLMTKATSDVGRFA